MTSSLTSDKKIVSNLKQRKPTIPSMAPLSDSTNMSNNKTVNKTTKLSSSANAVTNNTATTGATHVLANQEGQDENCKVQ